MDAIDCQDPLILFYIDDRPSIQLIDYFDLPHGRKVIRITERVSAQWEQLGYALQAEPYVINNIRRDHKSDGVTTCCRELLAKWLDRNFGDGKPTWDKFLTSLERINYTQLARCIRNQLTSQGMVGGSGWMPCVCMRHVVVVAYSYIDEIGDDDAVTGSSKTKLSALQF